MVASGDALKDLVTDFWPASTNYNPKFWYYRLLGAIFCIPPTYVRSLKSAAKFSTVATIGAVIMLGCIIIETTMNVTEGGIGGGQNDTEPQTSKLLLIPPTFSDFNQALPLLVITFSIHAGGIVILAALKPPTKPETVSKEEWIEVRGKAA